MYLFIYKYICIYVCVYMCVCVNVMNKRKKTTPLRWLLYKNASLESNPFYSSFPILLKFEAISSLQYFSS